MQGKWSSDKFPKFGSWNKIQWIALRLLCDNEVFPILGTYLLGTSCLIQKEKNPNENIENVLTIFPAQSIPLEYCQLSPGSYTKRPDESSSYKAH